MIPVEGLAFLDTVAVGEDYNPKDYNELYGGGKFTDYSAFPQWAGKDNSHAAGRYQFEPATWDEAQKATGVPDFSPASQDTAAWWLATTVYSKTGRDLLADLQAGELQTEVGALHSTWTSLSSANFAARYKAALIARTPPSPPAPPPAALSLPVPANDNELTLTLPRSLARVVQVLLEEEIAPGLATLIASLQKAAA